MSAVPIQDAEDLMLQTCEEALKIHEKLYSKSGESAQQKKPSKTSWRSKRFLQKKSSKRSERADKSSGEQTRQDSRGDRDGISDVREGTRVDDLEGIEGLNDDEKHADDDLSLYACESALDLHEMMMGEMKRIEEGGKDDSDDNRSVVSVRSLARKKRKKDKKRRNEEREAKKKKKDEMKKKKEEIKKKKSMLDDQSVTSRSSVSSISSFASVKSLMDKAKKLPSMKLPKMQALKEKEGSDAPEVSTQVSGEKLREEPLEELREANEIEITYVHCPNADNEAREGCDTREIKITYHQGPNAKNNAQSQARDPPAAGGDDAASFVNSTTSLEGHFADEGSLHEMVRWGCLALCIGGPQERQEQAEEGAQRGERTNGGPETHDAPARGCPS